MEPRFKKERMSRLLTPGNNTQCANFFAFSYVFIVCFVAKQAARVLFFTVLSLHSSYVHVILLWLTAKQLAIYLLWRCSSLI